MIAKCIKGKGFRGAVEYDLQPHKSILLETNMAGRTPWAARWSATPTTTDGKKVSCGKWKDALPCAKLRPAEKQGGPR